MTHHDKDIVPALRQHLAEQLGANRLALLERQAALRWERGELLVVAASDFALDRIRTGYRAALQQALAAIDPSLILRFVVDAAAVRAERPATTTVNLSADNKTTATEANGAHGTDGRPSWRPVRRKYHTFGEFVVGGSNRVAHAAAAELLASPHVSLLVLHGPTGSGKTHLLESIWSHAKQMGTARRFIYLSAEQFLNQFLEALHGAGLPSFRRKYRDLDLLLLDDIQHLANKTHTAVELQHTVDALLKAGHRVVLSCDRNPRDIAGLGEELIGRLSGGTVLPVDRPDAETREHILRRLCTERNLAFDDGVLRDLALELPADARLLAGAVNRLQAANAAYGELPTPQQTRELLADLLLTTARPVRLDEIVTAVCDEFGVTPDELQSDTRAQTVSHPRMLVMYLARKLTRAPLSEIGRSLGRRSHTTVLSAEAKVTEWLSAGRTMAGTRGQLNIADAVRRVQQRLGTG